VFNNKNPEEIASYIERLLSNKEMWKNIGGESQKWVRKNCAPSNFRNAIRNMIVLLRGCE
ncbi:MAG: hypothetical protein M1365_17070, partial [Actinobacteria bacterium]|nr:hypothetical protein [Actinomycetota bacterium]